MEDLPMRPGEEEARKGDLRGAVVKFVGSERSVTFVQLQEFLSPYMEVKGEATLAFDHLNLVLWSGVSEEFADFVRTLQGVPDLVLDACSPYVYIMDGSALNMPIAERPPANGYKEPHWAPTVLKPRSAVE